MCCCTSNVQFFLTRDGIVLEKVNASEDRCLAVVLPQAR